MKNLFAYLRAHPLVSILPLTLIAALVWLIARKMADTPGNPFIYDI
jgi:hypothetical protein